MKRIALFALLFAVAAVSAHATVEPLWGTPYVCDYSNYSGNATNHGNSTWVQTSRTNPGGTLLIRGLESFATSYGGDTYKCSWAKPSPDYLDPVFYTSATDWEFTFNPSGPQCKKATVTLYGHIIRFSNCTDGHFRTCRSLW